MGVTEYVGFFAALMTTSAFLPQTVKTIRTRRTKDISLLMYSVFILGIIFWVFYGLLKGDMILIVANVMTFLFALPTLWLVVANIREE